MAAKHHFDPEALRRLFEQAKPQPGVIRALTTPASARPWEEYRSIFITPERIAAGIHFWDANSAALDEASARYGVPAEIIVGIIGVETFYGRRTGSYRVIDSLTTLAFDSPQREAFFRHELEQYLLLTRDMGIDPLALKGSYAGAIGIPQFMPSSYRRYAVDFDGSGRPDLVNDVADAIGSIANYFKKYGWAPGEAVVVPARVTGEGYREWLHRGLEPKATVAQLEHDGVTPLDSVGGGSRASLIALETPGGERYWLGLNNFYVITRYNRSVYYAMAVYQLGEEVRALRQDIQRSDRIAARDAAK